MAYKNNYLVVFYGIFLWSSLFTPVLVGASRAELLAKAESVSPMSPEEVLADPRLVFCLTPLERQEIKQYPKIYYIGSACSKKATLIPPPKLEGVTEGDDRAISFNRREKEVNSPWKQGGHIAYRYEIVRKIGNGSHGEVIEAIDYKTGEHVAIKIQRNSSMYAEAGHREIGYLERLQACQNLGEEKTVCIFGHGLFRGHLYLILELVEGGDLRAALMQQKSQGDGRGFPLGRIRQISHHLLQALSLLKKLKIAHADIKLDNILCGKSGVVKLADFGISCTIPDTSTFYIQSRWYRAPELILHVKWGFPIDMWSLGCVLAELYAGTPVFMGNNESEQLIYQMELLGPIPTSVRDRSGRWNAFFSVVDPRSTDQSVLQKLHPVGTKRIEHVLGADVDPDFSDFILRCLDLNPDTRMTPEEALAHPFMREYVQHQDVFWVWMQGFLQEEAIAL